MDIRRVHLGKIIAQKVQERGQSKAAFARQIGIAAQNINKLVFDKSSLDTDLVCSISEILNCNLFDYFVSPPAAMAEVKATLTIELGEKRQDRILHFVFGEHQAQATSCENITIK